MNEGIDPNIQALVVAVNKLQGIFTTGSCGGHEKPKKGQCGPNEWYVQFDFTGKGGVPTRAGWGSAGALSHATFKYISLGGPGRVSIEFVNLSEPEEDPKGLCNYMEIHGRRGADIRKFFVALIMTLGEMGYK